VKVEDVDYWPSLDDEDKSKNGSIFLYGTAKETDEDTFNQIASELDRWISSGNPPRMYSR
jgi:hypothetical protein